MANTACYKYLRILEALSINARPGKSWPNTWPHRATQPPRLVNGKSPNPITIWRDAAAADFLANRRQPNTNSWHSTCEPVAHDKLKSINYCSSSPPQLIKRRLNLEIGTYYCCELENWKTGLPYLQDCSDQELAAAARADMTATDSDRESTGDLWWDLSLSESHQAHRLAFQKRAAAHYGMALRQPLGCRMRRLPNACLWSTPRRLMQSGSSCGESSPSIALGLKWLAKQQRSNGSWSLVGPYLDGATQEDATAATSMALLAFVRSGMAF